MNTRAIGVKIAMLGEQAVGKTCLLRRFAGEPAPGVRTAQTTIGVDFRVVEMQVGSRTLNVNIWDTAGQERFRVLGAAYFRAARGVFMVFDAADPRTFEKLKDWHHEVQVHAPDDVCITVVANKCDLLRAVPEEVSHAWAASIGAEYVECSAALDDDVQDMLTRMAECIAEQLPSKEPVPEAPAVDLAAPRGVGLFDCCLPSCWR